MTRSPVLTFLGATGTVTGSRFLVETSGGEVMVEAGLYQGRKDLRLRNWDPFPRPPAGIATIVLSHAHLDHCGYLPVLVKDGFAGRVLCTPETAELAAIVLRDSAHLQEEEAAFANLSGYSRHRPALPLYDHEDAERAISRFEPVDLHHRVQAPPGVSITLNSAGHILGSATILLEAGNSRVLFSGDLGRGAHPLIAPREDPPEADVIVLESTYGDRRHPAATSALPDAIRRTLRRHGTVLIPAFAVDRTELVLLEIGRLMQQRVIPAVPVFVDSPMALAALRVYRHANREAGVPPDFGIPRLRGVTEADDSARLNEPIASCIIVSASGMATGGRVTHHLAHQLPDPRNTVILTGYQAEGTRGRALLEGAREVKIHGRFVPVRAEVVSDDAFSAHADADELLGWLHRAPRAPRRVFVVHGEPGPSAGLAHRIERDLGWAAEVPHFAERVPLSGPHGQADAAPSTSPSTTAAAGGSTMTGQ